MFTTKRLLALLVTAGLAVLVTGPAAHAEPAVTHLEIHESEVSVSDFPPGDESCLPFSGTMTEHRDFDMRLLLHAGGEYHAEVTVHATFTLAPDYPTVWPTYSGSYREQGTGRGVLTPDGGDEPIVYSFHVPASATGSDDSTLRFLYRGHLTVTPDGTVRVEHNALNCIQSP